MRGHGDYGASYFYLALGHTVLDGVLERISSSMVIDFWQVQRRAFELADGITFSGSESPSLFSALLITITLTLGPASQFVTPRASSKITGEIRMPNGMFSFQIHTKPS